MRQAGTAASEISLSGEAVWSKTRWASSSAVMAVAVSPRPAATCARRAGAGGGTGGGQAAVARAGRGGADTGRRDDPRGAGSAVARYPQLVELLPKLLSDVQRAYAQDPEAGRVAVVEAYRMTAALLVKLDETNLAWLAADRAMSAATGDRVLVAAAAVQLGQVLRASAGARSVMLAAAYRIAPYDLDAGPPQELSLCGSLLVQAALMAARAGEDRATVELLDEAAEMAARVGDGHDHHRTGFGPTAVELARVAAAVAITQLAMTLGVV
jgi:hypothetical protein